MVCGIGGRDVISELRNAFVDTGIRLRHGIAMLVEALLRVAMLRPSQEQTMPQQTRPRVCNLSLPVTSSHRHSIN